MDASRETFDRIYDRLSKRLDQTGEISTQAAYQIVGGNYFTVARAFKSIMDTMIEQGKAKKLKNGRYNIYRPNSR